jgi:hypothetical protein
MATKKQLTDAERHKRFLAKWARASRPKLLNVRSSEWLCGPSLRFPRRLDCMFGMR